MEQSAPSYEELLDHSIDGTLVLDSLGTVLAVSDSLLRSFGFARSQWLGRSILEILHPEDAAAGGASLANVAGRPGRNESLNTRGKDAWGRWRPVEVVANTLEEPEGIVVLSVRDHTDAPDAPDRLVDRSELYRQVVEMAAEGVWMIDSALRTTFASAPMASMLGYTEAEMLGRSIFDFMDDEGRALAEMNIASRAEGDRDPQVFRLKHRDGRDIWVRVNLMELGPDSERSLADPDVYLGSVAIVSDITEAHLAAVSLEIERSQQKALLDAIPDLVFHFDSAGTYLDYAGNREDLAAEPEDFLGRPLSEIVSADMADLVVGAIGEALRTGDRQEIEYQMEVQGDLHDFEARLSPSGPDTVVAICRNVTALREAEQARREWALEVQRRKEAEKRAELEARMHQAGRLDALGRLTGGVAHDFNNLLGVIANYASVMRGSIQDPLVLQDLAGIQEAVARGSALTDRLLQVGRNAEASPAEVDVGEIVTGICQVLERTGGDSSVGIRVVVADSDCRARLDRSQLEQAVMNLVINARDASPKGAEVVVWVASEEDPAEGSRPEVRVSVCDRGSGIPEELRSQVLEPFFTTKEAGKGTGLGLSVVHRFVTEAEGRLVIDGSPSGGARVSMCFPACETSHHVAHGPSVLVVDDDAGSRRSTARLLEANGFGVLTADNYDAAVTMLENNEALGAVLCDVVMPGRSGVELDRHIRAHNPELPVIMMTGHAALVEDSVPEDRVVLTKPLALDKLVGSLRQCLAPVV